jgi:hypothetical protein
MIERLIGLKKYILLKAFQLQNIIMNIAKQYGVYPSRIQLQPFTYYQRRTTQNITNEFSTKKDHFCLTDQSMRLIKMHKVQSVLFPDIKVK